MTPFDPWELCDEHFFLQGKLIAGVHARVQIFKWTQKDDTTRELLQECSHTGHIMVLYLQTRGDFILVGEEPLPLKQHFNCQKLGAQPSLWQDDARDQAFDFAPQLAMLSPRTGIS